MYFVIRTILNSFRNHDCTFLRKDVYHLCSTNFRILLTSLVSSFKTEHRIETVQIYLFTRSILSNNMSYLDRSNFLKLEMLEERRIKADLVMFFKVMNNFTDVSYK